MWGWGDGAGGRVARGTGGLYSATDRTVRGLLMGWRDEGAEPRGYDFRAGAYGGEHEHGSSGPTASFPIRTARSGSSGSRFDRIPWPSGASEFAFVVQPLKLEGATGSTVAPVAIH